MHVSSSAEHGTGGVAALETAYTVTEAAERLGVSERHAWKLVGSGEITSIKIAGKRKVLAADLDAYVDRLRAAAASSTPPDDAQPPSRPPQTDPPPAGPDTSPPPAGPRVAGE